MSLLPRTSSAAQLQAPIGSGSLSHLVQIFIAGLADGWEKFIAKEQIRKKANYLLEGVMSGLAHRL